MGRRDYHARFASFHTDDSSYLLLLSLCLISFLLFSCTSVWKNTRAWDPHFLQPYWMVLAFFRQCNYKCTRESVATWYRNTDAQVNLNTKLNSCSEQVILQLLFQHLFIYNSCDLYRLISYSDSYVLKLQHFHYILNMVRTARIESIWGRSIDCHMHIFIDDLRMQICMHVTCQACVCCFYLYIYANTYTLTHIR